MRSKNQREQRFWFTLQMLWCSAVFAFSIWWVVTGFLLRLA